MVPTPSRPETLATVSSRIPKHPSHQSPPTRTWLLPSTLLVVRLGLPMEQDMGYKAVDTGYPVKMTATRQLPRSLLKILNWRFLHKPTQSEENVSEVSDASDLAAGCHPADDPGSLLPISTPDATSQCILSIAKGQMDGGGLVGNEKP
jgi:hypothetical protein